MCNLKEAAIERRLQAMLQRLGTNEAAQVSKLNEMFDSGWEFHPHGSIRNPITREYGWWTTEEEHLLAGVGTITMRAFFAWAESRIRIRKLTPKSISPKLTDSDYYAI